MPERLKNGRAGSASAPDQALNPHRVMSIRPLLESNSFQWLSTSSQRPNTRGVPPSVFQAIERPFGMIKPRPDQKDAQLSKLILGYHRDRSSALPAGQDNCPTGRRVKNIFRLPAR